MSSSANPIGVVFHTFRDPFGENRFHHFILGEDFGQSKSSRGIIPGATVNLFVPDNATISMFKNSPNRAKVSTWYFHPIIICIATVNDIATDTGPDVVQWEPNGAENRLDRICIENVVIHDLFKQLKYNYVLNSNNISRPNILADMEKKDGVCCWDSDAMKIVEEPKLRAVENETGTTVKLKEFHQANYDNAEIWLYVNQVRHVDNPLRDVQEEHRDTFVSTFKQEKCEVTLGIISVT